MRGFMAGLRLTTAALAALILVRAPAGAAPPAAAPAPAKAAPAAQAAAPQAAPQQGERRVALVIGNGAYRAVPALANSDNDARLMAATLRDLGFTLIGGGPVLDADKTAMENSIRDFGRALKAGAIGLFYYSGHGIQANGENYLVPVSASISEEADIKYELVDIAYVLDEMAQAGNRLNIIMLDACRNNPLGNGTRALSGGLGQMAAPAGTVISYATQPNNVALDGLGKDSPYTTALASALRKPGLDLFATFNEVGLEVKEATHGRQQPWLSVSPIEGQFYFAGRGSAAPPQSADADAAFWNEVKQSTRAIDLNEYITRFPNGRFTVEAQHRLTADCEAATQSGQGAQRRDLPLERIDTDQAITACRAAPATPHVDYLLGRALEAATRLPEAYKAYATAAESGLPEAETALAAAYDSGKGLPRDAAKAVHWYGKAADRGFAPAQTRLGDLYAQGQDGLEQNDAQARAWYEKAARQDEAAAQLALARLYEQGRGVAKDPATAVRWYRAAAQHGLAEAENALGYAYASGFGSPVSPSQAAQWYRKAAEQGYAPAERNLGWCYQYGQGVAADLTAAARWYEKAADQGDARAKAYLSSLGTTP